MSDFLDNLFDRHSDAMPQITPRLASIFEPEVSRSGLDLAVKEEAATPEETDIPQQPSRTAQPVGLPAVAEPVRPIVSPAPTVPVEEENPSVKVDLNSPAFSRAPRETSTLLPSSQGEGSLQGGDEERARGLNQGFLNPSTPLIAPVIPAMAESERPMFRSEPVINVTIGRIEVRATVSQQKQTPKSESRTPVMSLEEYLRRRSGGQDR